MLHWTRDWGRAQELAWRVAVLYAREFEQLREAMMGVGQWLAALRKANTPCALVSHMPAAHVKVTSPSAPALCVLSHDPHDTITFLPHKATTYILTRHWPHASQTPLDTDLGYYACDDAMHMEKCVCLAAPVRPSDSTTILQHQHMSRGAF